MSQQNNETNSNRPNPELDEALAWLENINSGSDSEANESDTFAGQHTGGNFPTWLREDLGIAQAKASKQVEPKNNKKSDNLSWLDGIASGKDAPLEARPTMTWEDTDIHQINPNELPTQVAPDPDFVSASSEQSDLPPASAKQDIESTELMPLPTAEQLSEAQRKALSIDSTTSMPIPTFEQLEEARISMETKGVPPLPTLVPAQSDESAEPNKADTDKLEEVSAEEPLPDIPTDFDPAVDTLIGFSPITDFGELDTQTSLYDPFNELDGDTDASNAKHDTADFDENGKAVVIEEPPTIAPTPSVIAAMPDIEEVRRMMDVESDQPALVEEPPTIAPTPSVIAAMPDIEEVRRLINDETGQETADQLAALAEPPTIAPTPSVIAAMPDIEEVRRLINDETDQAATDQLATLAEPPTIAPTPSVIAAMPDIEEVRRLINEETDQAAVDQSAAFAEPPTIAPTPSVIAAMPDIEEVRRLINEETDQAAADQSAAFAEPPTIAPTPSVIAAMPDIEEVRRLISEEAGHVVAEQSMAIDEPTTVAPMPSEEDLMPSLDDVRRLISDDFAAEVDQDAQAIQDAADEAEKVAVRNEAIRAAQLIDTAPVRDEVPELADELPIAEAPSVAEQPVIVENESPADEITLEAPVETIEDISIDEEINDIIAADQSGFIDELLSDKSIEQMSEEVSAETPIQEAGAEKPKIIIPGIKPVIPKKKINPSKNNRALVEIDLTADIPTDPDEAIAWLEKMAGNRNEYPYDEDVDGADEVVEDDVAAMPEMRDQSEDMTMVAPLEVFSTEMGMEAFLQELEASFDKNNANTAPITAISEANEETEPESVESELEALGLEGGEGEALGWLEQLVEGSAVTDDQTVELDQMDLASLLGEEEMEALRPGFDMEIAADKKSADPHPTNIDRVHKELLFEDEVEDESPTVVLDRPLPSPELPVGYQDEGTAVEMLAPEQGEQLHEALRWLESFSEEESSIITNAQSLRSDALPTREQEGGTIIEVYRSERVRARTALNDGDFQTVANEYLTLLQSEGSDEIVIGDMLKLIDKYDNQPLLYMVLGDAYKKQGEGDQALHTYRKGLKALLA